MKAVWAKVLVNEKVIMERRFNVEALSGFADDTKFPKIDSVDPLEIVIKTLEQYIIQEEINKIGECIVRVKGEH